MESDLILVPVVVLDAAGRPIAGLKRADFKLADHGKDQPIAYFEDNSSFDSPGGATRAEGEPETANAPDSPARFLSLFFDELNTSPADLAQARDAADHLVGSGLQPADHVAVFTTDGMLSDFTSDPRKIHETLSKLHVKPQDLKLGHACPDLSEYQARELMRDNDMRSDAWTAAFIEARQCAPTEFPSVSSDEVVKTTIRMLAQRIDGLTQLRAHDSLQGFERAVEYASQMPGQGRV